MKSMKTIILITLVFALIIPFIYSLTTKNPAGTSFTGEFHDVSHLEFLQDLSYTKDGTRVHEHPIIERELQMIEDTQEFLLLDFFLYNDEYDKDTMDFPNSVERMTDALIQKRAEKPDMPIVFITDPLNNFYGAYTQKHIQRLQDAGISVVITDLNKMCDSNPLFSGFYRAYLQWFGTEGHGWIPNFFEKAGPKVNVRSILKLANFKGNHRKVVINETEALVASANPHDPSALHSNVAVVFQGPAMQDLLETEKAVLAFSEAYIPEMHIKASSGRIDNTQLRILTERAIGTALEDNIRKAQAGDTIDITIFYLSDFSLIKELEQAAERGVAIRIIADANKDAFGLEKNGTPNRYALHALAEDYPVQLRWYETDGEQFHTKMAYFNYANESRAILGSANFTRRNLDDFNLETDVELVFIESTDISMNMEAYFNRLWNNENGQFTLDADAFEASNPFFGLLWKIQEFTGLCTW